MGWNGELHQTPSTSGGRPTTTVTRVYHAPIEVEVVDGRLRRFKWRSQWRDIKTVYERSVLQADWWRQEINRTHYSIECGGLEQYEIYRQGERWFLERVWD